MDTDILQRLTAATTDAEREAIVLEMSLAALSADVQAAVQAAAIPHWFDSRYLEALLGEGSDALYAELLTLNFVEQLPGKGYAIHERTRRQLLHNLWQDKPERFRTLSGRAADYCDAQASQTDEPEWQAEAIYHRLISDPNVGVAGLRGLATKWANYEYHTYDEIERALRWANEQLAAGRLTGSGADWTRLWQAKLALIYGRPHLATPPLTQITPDPSSDPYLAAELAQTRGDIFAQTEDRAGMETAWRTAYDLYRQLADGQGELDAYLVTEKMGQHGLAMPEGATETETRPKTTPSRHALRLIDNISAAWIEGVLNTALDKTIDLRMNRSATQPANLVYHRGQGMDRAVVAGQRLSRLFESAQRSLLILGAPGSGKTITLLQLLDELLQQARNDADAPIPLLFNLASFGAYAQEKGADLRNWLAEQAYEQYRLNRQKTREQLADAGNFVLLLDGLDEVPQAAGQREQCVTAINEFMQATPCGLVVCSRIGDYEALQNKLALSNALVLQPLANRQMEAFIEQVGGGQTAAMLVRMQADWQLREALRSPLLLNLYPQAFAALEAAFAESQFLANDTVETRRKALFAAYVDTIFAMSEQDDTTDKKGTVPKEKSIHWLSFLGNRMKQAGASLFFIEEMQPTWLPPPLVRRYRGLYGLFIGLIVGLMVRLILGLSDGLLIILIVGGEGAVATWLTTSIRRANLRASIGGLIVVLLTWLSTWLSFVRNDVLIDGTVVWLFVVLLAGLGIIISVGILSSWVSTIQLRERMVPLWPTPQKIFQYIQSNVYEFLIMLLIVLLVVLSYALSDKLLVVLSDGLLVELRNVLISVLIGLLIGVLITLFLAFWDMPLVNKRPKPSVGIRASLRNAFLVTLLVTLFFGLLGYFIDRAIESNYVLLQLIFIIILPPTFTWFGGLAWCQHWALRVVIARQGWLPLRLVPWLDGMVARGVLRRVGGGYIFIHRSLLEYFATLEEW